VSLIYQALKQSEQQSTASPSLVAKRSVAASVAGNKPGTRLRTPFGLGLMIAAAGVLVGYLLNQGFATPSSALASQPTAFPSGTLAGLYDLPDRPSPDTEAMGLLPRADTPLPTAAPRLQLALALSPELKKTRGSSEPLASGHTAITPASRPVEPTPVAIPVPPQEPAVAITTGTAEAAKIQPSTEGVRALFDALNQALALQDNALAQSKLQGIQTMLPESSVARLRAESWFAHQTGDLDGASRIYRRLLERLPGDELASVNLASIEKKQQRPDRAKDVLAKALRQNPSSSVLRSAIEQLAQSEVRP
jgi:tetratricopeptide (TPR) repeat protein